ncbi:MAG TPA: GGDEF domain-containing protein [Jatrophihabitans sp.]
MSITSHPNSARSPGSQRIIRNWPVWSLRPAGRRFLLATEFLVVVVTIGLLAAESVTSSDLLRFVALLVLGVGYSELADRVERIRRYLGSDQVRANHTSIWAFAGVLLLPPGQVALLVGILFLHQLVVGRRHKSVRPHRLLFSGATMIVGAFVASAVLSRIGHGIGIGDGGRAALAISAALVTYAVVSLLVMVVGIYLCLKPLSLSALLPERDEITFEIATLVLGVVTATFITEQPWLTPFALVLLGVLHRSSLVKQLQLLATTDAKTGLLNSVAWQQQAEKMFERIVRTGGTAAVLILDLDHFKSVNDEHGHLAGDVALRAVAQTLKQELRGYDLLSRYGGEEFVAFLDQVDAIEAMTIAERIRIRVSELRILDGLSVTGSVGIAIAPLDGTDVSTLLAGADAALYRAKAAGRDRVEAAWLA